MTSTLRYDTAESMIREGILPDSMIWGGNPLGNPLIRDGARVTLGTVRASRSERCAHHARITLAGRRPGPLEGAGGEIRGPAARACGGPL